MDYSKKDVNILIYDVIDFARLTRLWTLVSSVYRTRRAINALRGPLSVVAAAPSIHTVYNDIQPAGRPHTGTDAV